MNHIERRLKRCFAVASLLILPLTLGGCLTALPETEYQSPKSPLLTEDGVLTSEESKNMLSGNFRLASFSQSLIADERFLFPEDKQMIKLFFEKNVYRVNQDGFLLGPMDSVKIFCHTNIFCYLEDYLNVSPNLIKDAKVFHPKFEWAGSQSEIPDAKGALTLFERVRGKNEKGEDMFILTEKKYLYTEEPVEMNFSPFSNDYEARGVYSLDGSKINESKINVLKIHINERMNDNGYIGFMIEEFKPEIVSGK